MVNARRSISIAVGGDGGTSRTTANGTPFRRRGSARRATTRRAGQLLSSAQTLQQRGQEENKSRNNNINNNREHTGINYIEIKKLIERQQLLNKKGKLTESEIKSLVDKWHNHQEENDNIDQEEIEREKLSLQKAVEKYNVEQLGDIPTEREDGAIRILVCQMGGLASKEVREIKLAATEK
jgi:hypothetical protein